MTSIKEHKSKTAKAEQQRIESRRQRIQGLARVVIQQNKEALKELQRH